MIFKYTEGTFLVHSDSSHFSHSDFKSPHVKMLPTMKLCWEKIIDPQRAQTSKI